MINTVKIFQGNVFIPTGVDRDTYIQYCYKSETVVIKTADTKGIIVDGVRVDKNTIQQIVFPDQNNTYIGSLILCAQLINSNPVAFAIYQHRDQVGVMDEENSFKLVKKSSKGLIDITGKGNKGELSIVVDSTDNEQVASNMVFLNKKNLAKFNLKIQGVFDIEVDEKIDISTANEININIQNKETDSETSTRFGYVREKGFYYKDEFDNQIDIKKEEIDIKSKKFVFNSGKESGVLGDTLEDLLTDLISAINKITVATAVGPSGPPINIAEFQIIQQKLFTLKSKEFKLD